MPRNAIIAAVILLGAASLPATAQVRLEMNQVTCKNLLDSDFSRQEFIQYWMSGYYSASKNIATIDFNRMEKNSARVLAYCKKHKSATLPTAIRNSAR
jgi:hypothetical protein